MFWWMEVGREVGCMDGFSLTLVQHIWVCLIKSRGLAMLDEALDHFIMIMSSLSSKSGNEILQVSWLSPSHIMKNGVYELSEKE